MMALSLWVSMRILEIGGIVEPLSLSDDPISGVFADDESEDAANQSLFF